MAILKRAIRVPSTQVLTKEQKNRLVDLYGSVFLSSYEGDKRNALTSLWSDLTSFDYKQRQPAVATLTNDLFAAICGIFLEGKSTHSGILLELLSLIVKRQDIVFSAFGLPTDGLPTDALKDETLELPASDAQSMAVLGPANNIDSPRNKGQQLFRANIESNFDFSFRLFCQLDLGTITDNQKSELCHYVKNSPDTKLGILLGLLVNQTHPFTLENFGLNKEVQLNPRLHKSLVDGICASDSPLSLINTMLEKVDGSASDNDKFNLRDFIYLQIGDITVAIITKELQRSLPIAEKLTYITKSLDYFKPHIDNFIKQIDLSNNPEYTYNQLRQICTLLSNPMVCNLLTLSRDSVDKLVIIVEQLKSMPKFQNNIDWAQLTESLTASIDFYAALNADAKTNVGNPAKFNALLSDPAAYTTIKKEIDENRHDIREHILTKYLGHDIPDANKDRNKIAKLAYLLMSDPDLWKQVNPKQNYSFKFILYNIFGAYKNIFDASNPKSEISKLKSLHSSIDAKLELDTPKAVLDSPRLSNPGQSSPTISVKTIISPVLPIIPPPSQPGSPRAALLAASTDSLLAASSHANPSAAAAVVSSSGSSSSSTSSDTETDDSDVRRIDATHIAQSDNDQDVNASQEDRIEVDDAAALQLTDAATAAASAVVAVPVPVDEILPPAADPTSGTVVDAQGDSAQDENASQEERPEVHDALPLTDATAVVAAPVASAIVVDATPADEALSAAVDPSSGTVFSAQDASALDENASQEERPEVHDAHPLTDTTAVVAAPAASAIVVDATPADEALSAAVDPSSGTVFGAQGYNAKDENASQEDRPEVDEAHPLTDAATVPAAPAVTAAPVDEILPPAAEPTSGTVVDAQGDSAQDENASQEDRTEVDDAAALQLTDAATVPADPAVVAPLDEALPPAADPTSGTVVDAQGDSAQDENASQEDRTEVDDAAALQLTDAATVPADPAVVAPLDEALPPAADPTSGTVVDAQGDSAQDENASQEDRTEVDDAAALQLTDAATVPADPALDAAVIHPQIPPIDSTLPPAADSASGTVINAQSDSEVDDDASQNDHLEDDGAQPPSATVSAPFVDVATAVPSPAAAVTRTPQAATHNSSYAQAHSAMSSQSGKQTPSLMSEPTPPASPSRPATDSSMAEPTPPATPARKRIGARGYDTFEEPTPPGKGHQADQTLVLGSPFQEPTPPRANPFSRSAGRVLLLDDLSQEGEPTPPPSSNTGAKSTTEKSTPPMSPRL